MVLCLGRGADLRVAQLMLQPLTVSCSSKSRLVLPFLVPAHLGIVPDTGSLNGCCCCCTTALEINADREKVSNPFVLAEEVGDTVVGTFTIRDPREDDQHDVVEDCHRQRLIEVEQAHRDAGHAEVHREEHETNPVKRHVHTEIEMQLERVHSTCTGGRSSSSLTRRKYKTQRN